MFMQCWMSSLTSIISQHLQMKSNLWAATIRTISLTWYSDVFGVVSMSLIHESAPVQAGRSALKVAVPAVAVWTHSFSGLLDLEPHSHSCRLSIITIKCFVTKSCLRKKVNITAPYIIALRFLKAFLLHQNRQLYTGKYGNYFFEYFIINYSKNSFEPYT